MSYSEWEEIKKAYQEGSEARGPLFARMIGVVDKLKFNSDALALVIKLYNWETNGEFKVAGFTKHLLDQKEKLEAIHTMIEEGKQDGSLISSYAWDLVEDIEKELDGPEKLSIFTSNPLIKLESEKQTNIIIQGYEKIKSVEKILMGVCEDYENDECLESCDCDPNGYEGCYTRKILEAIK